MIRQTETLLRASLVIVGMTGPAVAEMPIADLPAYDRFAILAIGTGPQYLGADESVWAPIPAGQLNFGQNRRITLLGNYLSSNIVDHPNWRFGPAGVLRFGRRNVDDAEVSALPDIDMSLDLGVSLSYAVRGDDIRQRWITGVGVLHDVTGAHDGYVLAASSHAWFPVGRFGALGLGAAASWGSGDYMDTYFSVDASGSAASGLPFYSAGSGGRDVRAMAVFLQPVNERWAVGAGLLYGWLLDEAAESPVVDSRSQLFVGLGITRAW